MSRLVKYIKYIEYLTNTVNYNIRHIFDKYYEKMKLGGMNEILELIIIIMNVCEKRTVIIIYISVHPDPLGHNSDDVDFYNKIIAH